MLVEKGELSIRLMEDGLENYLLMVKWLTDVRVLEFYEGRDNPFNLPKVIETYKPIVIGHDVVKPILTMAVSYIFEVLFATKIVIDPHVDNTRATRCYEKVWFVKVKLLPAHELHEGKYSDGWLMANERKKSLH
jgi:aminoglycoside 6'-N-acetyltransferase